MNSDDSIILLKDNTVPDNLVVGKVHIEVTAVLRDNGTSLELVNFASAGAKQMQLPAKEVIKVGSWVRCYPNLPVHDSIPTGNNSFATVVIGIVSDIKKNYVTVKKCFGTRDCQVYPHHVMLMSAETAANELFPVGTHVTILQNCEFPSQADCGSPEARLWASVDHLIGVSTTVREITVHGDVLLDGFKTLLSPRFLERTDDKLVRHLRFANDDYVCFRGQIRLQDIDDKYTKSTILPSDETKVFRVSTAYATFAVKPLTDDNACCVPRGWFRRATSAELRQVFQNTKVVSIRDGSQISAEIGSETAKVWFDHWKPLGLCKYFNVERVDVQTYDVWLSTGSNAFLTDGGKKTYGPISPDFLVTVDATNAEVVEIASAADMKPWTVGRNVVVRGPFVTGDARESQLGQIGRVDRVTDELVHVVHEHGVEFAYAAWQLNAVSNKEFHIAKKLEGLLTDSEFQMLPLTIRTGIVTKTLGKRSFSTE